MHGLVLTPNNQLSLGMPVADNGTLLHVSVGGSLLGRIPSRVGYQSALGTELAELEELKDIIAMICRRWMDGRLIMTPQSPERAGMQLRVVTPTGSVIDKAVTKVVAEGPNGAFGLLPCHIDFVSELPPGIVFYRSPNGQDHVVAINEGTLVKTGDLVLISTRDAIVGDDLDALEDQVKNTFLQIDDHGRTARTELAPTMRSRRVGRACWRSSSLGLPIRSGTSERAIHSASRAAHR